MLDKTLWTSQWECFRVKGCDEYEKKMQDGSHLSGKGPIFYYSRCCGAFIPHWDEFDSCPSCGLKCEVEVMR